MNSNLDQMSASSQSDQSLVVPGRPRWLDGTVGYEIYVRSFADSNGDGVGDLPGITSRLDYLKWLGIDIVWVTPCYPSPGFDHGYDVSDYCAIDPKLGTMHDMDSLIERTHQLGMKLIMDIVPNHTSSHHKWFQTAVTDPTSEERDFYIWKDPAADGGPPNNWPSHFVPSAWTLEPTTNQYYCHLFLPEQPDLNWRNPQVRNEFDNIYRFWFERGVDGFRIDVAHALLKHPSFQDIPPIVDPSLAKGPLEFFFSFDHKYDLDQDDNTEIYKRWKNVAAEYDACLVAENGLDDYERNARCTMPGALDLTFFLKPSRMSWKPERLIEVLLKMSEAAPYSVAWCTSNHDNARPASRFGTGEQGRSRSLALTTLMFSLGGVPFLYQGEELGSPNGEIRPEDRHDPISTRNDTDEGRDVCRTAMAWNTDRFNGFSTVQPWIKSVERMHDFTVAGQHENPHAPLHRYRRLVSLRKYYPDLVKAELNVVNSGRDDVAIIQRGRTLTVANLGTEGFAVDLGQRDWQVIFASQGTDGDTARGIVNVSPETSVVFALL